MNKTTTKTGVTNGTKRNAKPVSLDAATRKALREEQDRTRVKKKLFIEYFGKTMCMIKETCDYVGIGRTTFHTWRKEDPDFADAILLVEAEEKEDIDSAIKKLILAGDGPTIRFVAERVIPKYKSKNVVEHTTDRVSFEEEVESIINAVIKDMHADSTMVKADRQSPKDSAAPDDREKAKDPQQAKTARGSKAKRGAGVLLESSDAT